MKVDHVIQRTRFDFDSDWFRAHITIIAQTVENRHTSCEILSMPKLKSYGEHKASGGELLVFHCPGCKYDHAINVNGREGYHPQWTWNGSLDTPTFSPSLLVNQHSAPHRCHSFIKDGRVEFLSDCHHELRGQTVEMPEYED